MEWLLPQVRNKNLFKLTLNQTSNMRLIKNIATQLSIIPAIACSALLTIKANANATNDDTSQSPCTIRNKAGILSNYKQLQEDLAYAYDHSSLVNVGTRGKVHAKFETDKTGNIKRVLFIESTYPDFTDIVLDHTLPTPVNVSSGDPTCDHYDFDYRFEFTIPGVGEDNDGLDAFHVDGKPSSPPPAEYQYDVPPAATHVTRAVYPKVRGLAQEGGTARVIVVIDKAGNPARVVIADASQPEFGHALKANVETWHFQPAQKDGQPTNAMLRYSLRFIPNHNRAEESHEGALTRPAELALERLSEHPDEIIDKKRLDSTPTLIYQPPFIYPLDVPTQAQGATVDVEFLVDDAGRVQWPALVHGVQDDLDWAALATVAQWRFSPPLLKGKPVTTRMQASFDVGG